MFAGLVGVIILVLALGFYMLPTIIGASRKVVNIGSVFAINLLLGWTLIGWAIALAMALRTNPPHAYPQMWVPPASLPQEQFPAMVSARNPPSLPPPAGPPAGWYPDPADPSSQRWWDGQRWAEPALQVQSLSEQRPQIAATPFSLRYNRRINEWEALSDGGEVVA